MVVKHYFSIDGVPCTNFGFFVSNTNQFDTPERDVSVVEVPGRNGTLSIDNGRFKNITREYDVYVQGDIRTSIRELSAFMASRRGYRRIEDTFDEQTYMLARASSGIKVTDSDRKGAAFTISFDCDPRRFYKSGENIITLEKSGTIFNPTYFSSKPLIRVYGTGTITINGVAIKVNKADSYTDIDCEHMDCYKSGVNCNGNVTLTDGKFPELPQGTSDIVLSGITRAEITPRWFTI